jgi:hypothetical protein
MEADLRRLEEGSLHTPSTRKQHVAYPDQDYLHNLSDDSNPLPRGRSPPASESGQASRASSAGTIGIKNPGPWVLHHHKQAFIAEIRKPIEFQSIYEKVGYYFGEWNRGFVSWAESRLGKGAKQNKKRKMEKASDRDWEDRRFRMSFAELQRMKLRKLQIQLVGNVVDMHKTNRESEEWESTLKEYGIICVLD